MYCFGTIVRFCNTQKKAGELETLGLYFQLACFNTAGISVRILLSFTSSVPNTDRRTLNAHHFARFAASSASLLASLLAGPEYKECLFFVSAPHRTLRIAVRLRAIDVPEPEWRPDVGDAKSDAATIIAR